MEPNYKGRPCPVAESDSRFEGFGRSRCTRDVPPGRYRLCMDRDIAQVTWEDAQSVEAWLDAFKSLGFTLVSAGYGLFKGITRGDLPALGGAFVTAFKRGELNAEFIGNPRLCGDCLGKQDCPTHDAVRAEMA